MIDSVLGLNVVRQHPWHIESCCAITGTGLEAGMTWFGNAIKERLDAAAKG